MEADKLFIVQMFTVTILLNFNERYTTNTGMRCQAFLFAKNAGTMEPVFCK
jgi:hypothetical protein